MSCAPKIAPVLYLRLASADAGPIAAPPHGRTNTQRLPPGVTSRHVARLARPTVRTQSSICHDGARPCLARSASICLHLVRTCIGERRLRRNTASPSFTQRSKQTMNDEHGRACNEH